MEMKKILIIEDNIALRDVLRINLILEGYSIFTAQSGEEGLLLFDRVYPHLVVSDFNLPGMNGFELLQRIMVRRPDAPVILLTGSVDVTKTEAKRLGAADMLIKPISRKTMCSAIDKVLKKRFSHLQPEASTTLEST